MGRKKNVKFDTKITCIICKTPVIQKGISQFAEYGGLPSPCCRVCFSVNDYNIKSLEQLQAKSLLKRATDPEAVKALEEE